MKRTLFSAALVAALTTPILAGTDSVPMASHDGKDMKDMKQAAAMNESDSGFYVAAYGGAQFMTGYGNNEQIASNGSLGAQGTHQEIHSTWGGVGGIKAGYNFNSMPLCNFMSLRLQPAVEAEALYIGDSSKVRDFADGGFNINGGGGGGGGADAVRPEIVANPADAGSSEKFTTNSGDFFLNGILRFKNSSMVTPYVGIGAGLQYITTHGEIDVPRFGFEATGVNTSDLDFAAQALVGFDVAICRHISIFTEYKFIDALGTDGKSTDLPTPGGTYRFKPDQIEQNLITAGVKYSF